MSFNVIDNPHFKAKARKAGFSNSQFKRLDALYLHAASSKILNHRTVECDFDEGMFEYNYHKTKQHRPILTFIIRHVGPRTNMYELWTPDKGKISQSGLFDRTYEKLKAEIDEL